MTTLLDTRQLCESYFLHLSLFNNIANDVKFKPLAL